MTDDLQQLDGIGPSREETLIELGYETFSDLAKADPEQLNEDINRLSEDTALSLVVQGQNAADLEEAEVEEDPDMEEKPEVVEDENSNDATYENDDDDSEGEEVEEDELNTVPLALSFNDEEEYDAFFDAVYQYRNELLRTNRGGVAEVYDGLLDSLREIDSSGKFEHRLSPDELNDLHNAVRTKSVEYQGQSLIEQMEALDRVEIKINSIREEYLF